MDTDSLAQLLVEASHDPRQEAALFRALLQAQVYVHVPQEAAPPQRIRFVQFPHPQTGQLLLPFFTDETKALIAAGAAVRVRAMTGRTLMELTQGATLMMNPNDERCLLYPEEVAALLRTGTVPVIEKVTVTENHAPQVGPAGEVPVWLETGLLTAFATLPFVELAYLARLHATDTSPGDRLIVALGTTPGQGERAVHAVITAIQPLCRAHDLPLDITCFDVPGHSPEWIGALELAPLYRRRAGQEGPPPDASGPTVH